jgi:TRAP-type C4-dicarboxylate transport system permease small subunit
MHSIRRIEHRLAQLIEVPAVIVMFVMMLHITVNALMRTFWHSPIDNTLEVVQYIYMPIMALLGFVAAQARGQHIVADLVFEMLPSVTRRFVGAAVSLVSSLMCAAIAWFGWSYATHAQEIGQTAGLTDIPSWPVYYLIPAVFAALTVLYLSEATTAFVQPDGDGEEQPTIVDGIPLPDLHVTEESRA